MARPEKELLSYMPEEVIRTCAMRVFYTEKTISAEFFHSLTDGHGGMVFVLALLTKYLFLSGRLSAEEARRCWPLFGIPAERQTADDYLTYAGRKTAPMNRRQTYCLPGDPSGSQRIYGITGSYDLKEMLELSHRFHVSLTVLLTAIMMQSIVEMQTENRERREYEPVQIMVPVDLRKRFPSSSVRNFSLYALPCLEPFEFSMDLEALTGHLDRQMKRQVSREYLGERISSCVRMQKKLLVRCIPLSVKETVLRALFSRFVEKNSCITLSNLGEILLPDAMKAHVEQMGILLSPRRNAPYNCGVLSCGGRLMIGFSRRGESPGLEGIFFRRLQELGCHGTILSGPGDSLLRKQE